MTFGNTPATESGFEGPEKLVEIFFNSIVDSTNKGNLSPAQSFDLSPARNTVELTLRKQGLRSIPLAKWEKVLALVQCQVLETTENDFQDAFLLSESSMFVTCRSIMIKTCGTTILLKALPAIFDLVSSISFHSDATPVTLVPCALYYSRKRFLFPTRQPAPHTSWKDEVEYLVDVLEDYSEYGSLTIRPKNVISEEFDGDWLCFNVDFSIEETDVEHINNVFMDERIKYSNLEILMTDLDVDLLEKFWRKDSLSVEQNKEYLFKKGGISSLHPQLDSISHHVFDPCGYSINGILDDKYFTIHVTPESHCSYASFETLILPDSNDENARREYTRIIRNLVKIFNPKKTSFILSEPNDSKCGKILTGMVRNPKNVHSIDMSHHRLTYFTVKGDISIED